MVLPIIYKCFVFDHPTDIIPDPFLYPWKSDLRTSFEQVTSPYKISKLIFFFFFRSSGAQAYFAYWSEVLFFVLDCSDLQTLIEDYTMLPNPGICFRARICVWSFPSNRDKKLFRFRVFHKPKTIYLKFSITLATFRTVQWIFWNLCSKGLYFTVHFLTISSAFHAAWHSNPKV